MAERPNGDSAENERSDLQELADVGGDAATPEVKVEGADLDEDDRDYGSAGDVDHDKRKAVSSEPLDSSGPAEKKLRAAWNWCLLIPLARTWELFMS